MDKMLKMRNIIYKCTEKLYVENIGTSSVCHNFLKGPENYTFMLLWEHLLYQVEPIRCPTYCRMFIGTYKIKKFTYDLEQLNGQGLWDTSIISFTFFLRLSFSSSSSPPNKYNICRPPHPSSSPAPPLVCTNLYTLA